MSTKITIIGAGSVGATIAYTLSMEEYVSEIVMIDINQNKATGEAMDIIQGASFRNPISVIAGDYQDAKDSDIVIITSGVARKPGQSRIELTQTNVNIMKDIAPKIVAEAPNSLYIIVSNPVDIMTYAFTKLSGLPERQVIGSGTLLDTARLRYALSEHFNIGQKNIHSYVLGEHGDSSFVPWSLSRISGATIDQYTEFMQAHDANFQPLDKNGMEDYVHKAGGNIIEKKGATFYAVSVSVCKLCSLLLSSSESITTVSTMLHGEYGIEDICLSIPTLVGPEGVKGKLALTLTAEEEAKLKKSAAILKDVIDNIVL